MKSIQVLLLFVLLAVAGCHTERIDGRRLVKAEVRNSDVVARFCGKVHPPKVWDSIGAPVYVAGDTVWSIDTVYSPAADRRENPPLPLQGGESRVVYRDIIKNMLVRDTVKVTNTRQVENTARADGLEADLKQCQYLLRDATGEVQELKGTKRKGWIAFGCLLLVNIVALGIKWLVRR